MWFFNKKKESSPLSDTLTGMTDVHSHLLWGVDDGSKSAEQTSEMIRHAAETGIKRTFCTPHIMARLPKNSAKSLEEEFRQKITQTNGLEIRLAAEYMLDENFMQVLENERILTYDGKHLLIEMSHIGVPPNLHEMIFEIINRGYTPILAHPERYTSFIGDDQYKKLKEYGCLFQLNMLSLGEIYGTRTNKKAHELLESGSYDFIGSDMHNLRMIHAISAISLSKSNQSRIKELVSNNDKLWQK